MLQASSCRNVNGVTDTLTQHSIDLAPLVAVAMMASLQSSLNIANDLKWRIRAFTKFKKGPAKKLRYLAHSNSRATSGP